MIEDTTVGQTAFGFGMAVYQLKEGNKVTRRGWNKQGMFLSLQIPDANSKMKQPYIFITPDADSVIPWVASQVDILAEDWCLIENL